MWSNLVNDKIRGSQCQDRRRGHTRKHRRFHLNISDCLQPHRVGPGGQGSLQSQRSMKKVHSACLFQQTLLLFSKNTQKCCLPDITEVLSDFFFSAVNCIFCIFCDQNCVITVRVLFLSIKKQSVSS